ncbi:MAG: HNH endonuclease [Eubacteriaceae bacterium]
MSIINKYDISTIQKVLLDYLYNGKSHRQIQKETLHLPAPNNGGGYETMKILHHFNIRKNKKSVLQNQSFSNELNTADSKYKDALMLIKNIFYSQKYLDEHTLNVHKSLKSSKEERQKRIMNANKRPRTITLTTTTYQRNPDIVAETLERSSGICEKCNQSAPFLKSSDNSPYLEVHHIIPLSKGGYDSIDNTIAVCPNCHREMHYG